MIFSRADHGSLRRLLGRGRGRAAFCDRAVSSFLRVCLIIVFALSAGGHGGGAHAGPSNGTGLAGVLFLCGAVDPSGAEPSAPTLSKLNCVHCLVCSAAGAPEPLAAIPAQSLVASALLLPVQKRVAAGQRSQIRRARAPPSGNQLTSINIFS